MCFKDSFELRRGGGSSTPGYCKLHRINQALNVLTKRPVLHPPARGLAHFLEPPTIWKDLPEDPGESFHITSWMDKTRVMTLNEIVPRPDSIANHCRHTAAHRFIHHQAERFVEGRKAQEVGRSIDARKLRLVDEPQKADPIFDSEGSCFPLQL